MSKSIAYSRLQHSSKRYAEITLTTCQIANGEFKLNLANQILSKIAKIEISGEQLWIMK